MSNDAIKILLVEDDEDDYIMTRDLLAEVEGTKYELKWVSSVDEAHKEMTSKRHDVFLVDYRLGELTGVTLMRRVIQSGCKTPIILLTGQSDKEIDLEAMEAGASDYLVKGQIDARLLERSIRYAIERKKSEAQIRRMAYFDHLTNLPNRVLFRDRLHLAINHGKSYERKVALLFIDIDNFKRINDTFGHTMGDLLLKSVANFLDRSIRLTDSVSRNVTEGDTVDEERTDTVARLGGDEFIILLTEIARPHDAARVARRILKALEKPLLLEGNEVFVRVSIGIATFPEDGNDIDNLLKNSDAAMYHAKSQGKNNYQFYNRSMNSRSHERLKLENSLHRVIAQDELRVYYQPQMDVRKGKITGMEALLRWQHPERGMILPSEFIPVAEDTGLILSMSEWMMDKACSQNKAWQAEGLDPVRIAVNLSGQQFRGYDLIGAISHTLNTSGLDPRWLELEITENMVMQNMQAIIETLRELKNMGLRFAMDDFGTGYSSFASLKRFSLDLIKIDRSLVQDITTNADSVAIVAAIIAMAKNLKLSVIAEGIETEAQQAILVEHGCYHVQGFLYSAPLPPDEATKFLRRYSEVESNC